MDFKQLNKDVDEFIEAGVPKEVIDGYIKQNGFTIPEFKLANENYGTFMSAVKRSGKNIGSLIGDFLPAMGADLLEKIAPDSFKPQIEAYKQRQLEEAAKTQEEIAKTLPAQYESFEQVTGPLSALGYFKEAAGEAIPSLLPGVVTGGVGSVLSRGAVAAAGQAASQAAKNRVLASAPAAAIESGAAETLAAKAAIKAAEKAMAAKTLQAQAIGAYTGSAALTIPDAYQAIYSETGKTELLPALGAGLFNAALDAVTPVSILRAAKGKGLTESEILGAWYMRGIKGAVKGAGAEGLTEGLQEITNAAAVKFVDENKEIFTPENFVRFIDSSLKGAIGGGIAVGATSAAFGKKEAAPKTEESTEFVPPPGAVPGGQGVGLGVSPAPFSPLTGERDLAGMVPKGAYYKPTEELEPIIGPDGKVTGYRPAKQVPPRQELEGEQLGLPISEQGELPLTPREQPIKKGELRNIEGELIYPEELKNVKGEPLAPDADLAKPIDEYIKGVVEKAKKDTSASKLLKANNPATAKIIADRIQALLPSPGADPTEAMEQLYEQDKTGRYPAGTKALSEAQRELLQTIYRRRTGRDIEDTIRDRAFAKAQQGELFPEGDVDGTQQGAGQGELFPGTAGTDVGVTGQGPGAGVLGQPTGGAVGAPGVGVGGGELPPAGGVGGTGTKPSALTPEEAWNRHKNDDHPAFTELSPEEQAAWSDLTARGRDTAPNFQDLVEGYVTRTTKQPEEIKKIFAEETKITTADIESELAGKDFKQLLDYMTKNGPLSMQEVMKEVAKKVDLMRKKGFDFTFTLVQTPGAARRVGLSSRASGHVSPVGKTMNLVLAGRGSGRIPGNTFEVAAHELLHTVTIPLIRYGSLHPTSKEGKIVQELEALSDHIKAELKKRIKNGTATYFEQSIINGTNVFGKKFMGSTIHKADEMVSWGMTNSEYRGVLESIPYKGKTVLDAFVEAIRRLIGLSPKADTALSEIIRLSNELFQMQVPANIPFFSEPVTYDYETPAFKKWFGNSKIKNADGSPKVMYHGTAADIETFVPGKAGAIFVTSDPEFAGTFTQYSEDRLADEIANSIDNNLEQKLALISPIIDAGIAENRLATKENSRGLYSYNPSYWVNYFLNKPLKESMQSVGIGKELQAEIKKLLPTGKNIIPVYVKAEKPFDYNNPKHVEALGISSSKSASLKAIKKGDWPTIEMYQDDIQDAGFDSFYVNEYGQKNLAVFKPNQIKSAIGNRGTYGTSPSIVESVYADPITFDSEFPLPPVTPPVGPSVVPAPGQPYTLPQLTKVKPAPTVKQSVVDTAKKITDAYNDSSWWTKFRIAAVDPTAGLAKTLSSLPVFQDGKLRGDMLIRAFSQVINLIKNGIQSGIPVINADGTVVIQRNANNLARSQVLADELDNNSIVKGSKLSGRGYVAEIARILRGDEIMKVDAHRRFKAGMAFQEAERKMQQAKQLQKQGRSITEVTKLVNEAKALRKRYRKDLNANREKQVTQAHLDWANQQLKAVPQVQEILNIWDEVNQGLITLWENSGLLTEEQAAYYRSMKNYVPLYAAREDLPTNEQEAYTGTRTGTKTVRELDHLEGTDLQRNIWENLDKHYASMTAAAFQNQTRKVAAGQLLFLKVARVAKDPDDKNINLRYRDPTDPDADKHGVMHLILDNSNDLAAFQTMHYPLGALMKGISATTQVLRGTALINPMYWIRQLIRDPIQASLVANSGIVTPFHSAAEYLRVLAGQSEEAKILASRGVIGQVDSTVDLQDFLKQVGTEKVSPSKLDEMIRKVMRMHEASDAATRVALFKKARDEGLRKGMSAKEAEDYGVFKARESINFGIRGNSQTLNTLRHMIPFFSATIVSLDTLYRAATGYGLNPKEKAEAQRIFYSRALMMAALSTVYAMMLQDDEDYKKLPDNVKDNNWLLPSPIGDERSFIKISIPYEVGFLFKTLPEAFVRYMADTSTGKETLASVALGIKRNLPGEGILIPQAFKPALESVTNYSFFTGRPIEGMSDKGLPVEYRGPHASELAKTLSSFGLNKIELSPAKIDALIQGYLAELGTFSTGLASSAINAATGKEPPAKNLEQMPFFKAFLTNPNTSKAATDYYEISNNAQEAVNAFNRMKKEGRIEEAKEFVSKEENKKLMTAAPSLRKIQDQMSAIRTQINVIERNERIDPETRRQRINQLMTTYDKVARQGYKVLEAAGIER